MNPKVSVIIPNYNHSKYLRERIESVLNQSYQDFEVIILDDCSSDNSKVIIKEYEDNPKVSHIVFNTENSGSTFKQWKKGFDLAQGEYIWIAESDDMAHPDFLKIILSSINEDKSVVLAASGITFIDENSKITGHFTISKSKHPRIYNSQQFIRENMLLGNHLLNASSAIFRRDVVKDISNEYTTLQASGDYLFWLELANKGKVVEVPDELDYFRKYSTSVTPRLYGTGQTFDEAKIIFNWLIRHGYLKGLYRNIVIAFRLNQIKKGTKFNNEEVRKRCYDNWRELTSHPILDKSILLSYGVCRRLRRLFRNML